MADSTTAPSNERRLESWGEIASYLRREIRTVQRWERNLSLPIHRLAVGKQSAVFAYPSELDRWYKERETRIERDDLEEQAATSSDPVHPEPPSNGPANIQTGLASNGETARPRHVPWKWL